MRKAKTTPGFTIVELLIVIVVIAILAAITIVAYGNFQDRAEVAVLNSDLTQAAKQLGTDKALSGSYPTTKDAANGNKGLSASIGVDYEYTANGSGFCLSAVKGDKAYHVTETSSPAEGVCTGHSGPVADGGDSLSCDTGYIPVPGNSAFGTSDFCVAKYEAKNVGGVATSQAGGTPWVSISQTNAMSTASSACSGCHLITEAEWLTIAHNVLNVPGNWSGGSVGSGYIYSGHNDNNPANSLAASSSDSDGYQGTGNSSGNQRRTLALSNGEVIWDLAGNVYEWTSGQTSGGQPGVSGYLWREWKNVAGTGSLTPNPFPSFGTPAASTWTSSNGIGRLYSDSDQTGLRGFFRGGTWNIGSQAGVFTLYLFNAPSYTFGSVGFRIAQ